MKANPRTPLDLASMEIDVISSFRSMDDEGRKSITNHAKGQAENWPHHRTPALRLNQSQSNGGAN